MHCVPQAPWLLDELTLYNANVTGPLPSWLSNRMNINAVLTLAGNKLEGNTNERCCALPPAAVSCGLALLVTYKAVPLRREPPAP